MTCKPYLYHCRIPHLNDIIITKNGDLMMRKAFIALIIIASVHLPIMALDIPTGIDLPRDPINIELAIDFHKTQIELLNYRIAQTELLRQQQTEVTNKNSKLDRLMDTLHVRERGIMNWLYFADNLNTIRVNFQKIYRLENKLLDLVSDWALSTPSVSFKSLNGIKGTYRDLGAKAAVLMLGYDSQVKFIKDTKALYRLFAAQFGGEVMDNTFSGKMKNLTTNLGTDLQRRSFTNRVLTKQYEMIAGLNKKIELIKYTVLGYYKFDLIGGALDFLDKEEFYKNAENRVEMTFYENSFN